MDGVALLHLIKKIFQKAGLPSRKAYPYCFRHTAITRWSEAGLNEAVIKYRAGHAANSTMLNIYTHIRASAASESYLRAMGVIKEENHKEEFVVCPRCGRINKRGAAFCSRCSAPLSLEAAAEMQEASKEEEDILRELLADKEVRDLLLKKIREESMEKRGTQVIEAKKAGKKNPLAVLERKSQGGHKPKKRE